VPAEQPHPPEDEDEVEAHRRMAQAELRELEALVQRVSYTSCAKELPKEERTREAIQQEEVSMTRVFLDQQRARVNMRQVAAREA
jgi:hypothetical protein